MGFNPHELSKGPRKIVCLWRGEEEEGGGLNCSGKAGCNQSQFFFHKHLRM